MAAVTPRIASEPPDPVQEMETRMDYMLRRLNGEPRGARLREVIAARQGDLNTRIQSAVAVAAHMQNSVEDITEGLIEETRKIDWAAPEKKQAERLGKELEEMRAAQDLLLAGVKARQEELRGLNVETEKLGKTLDRMKAVAPKPKGPPSLGSVFSTFGQQLLAQSTRR